MAYGAQEEDPDGTPPPGVRDWGIHTAQPLVLDAGIEPARCRLQELNWDSFHVCDVGSCGRAGRRRVDDLRCEHRARRRGDAGWRPLRSRQGSNLRRGPRRGVPQPFWGYVSTIQLCVPVVSTRCPQPGPVGGCGARSISGDFDGLGSWRLSVPVAPGNPGRLRPDTSARRGPTRHHGGTLRACHYRVFVLQRGHRTYPRPCAPCSVMTRRQADLRQVRPVPPSPGTRTGADQASTSSGSWAGTMVFSSRTASIRAQVAEAHSG